VNSKSASNFFQIFISISIFFLISCSGDKSSSTKDINTTEELNVTDDINVSEDINISENLVSSVKSLIYPNLTKKQLRSLEKRVIKMQKPSEDALFVVSKNWLRLTLIPKRAKDGKSFLRQPLDLNKLQNLSFFSLSDEQNNTLAIESVGLKRRTIYAPLKNNDLRLAENIFIHITDNLEKEKSYTLKVSSELMGREIQLSTEFNPQNQLSDLLHVNTYGFTPLSKKKAYLGLMMGSAGEFNPNDLNFKVISTKSHKVLFEGVGKKELSTGWRESFSNHPYNNVYVLDFSDLKEEGEYYIQHSTGISQPFMIASDAYRNFMNTMALGIYNQRRGESIHLPYSRHERKATIENNTFVYDSSNLDSWLTSQLGWGDGIKYPTTLEEMHVDISGGHMDAGDYSPYTYSSSLTVWRLITTLDFYGERVAHDNLGIPESGDGIPDLLQELLLEIKWLKNMQDSIDGGVFGMSKPKGMYYQSTMTGVQENLTRYLAPKDTTVTASYAAALARLARSRTLIEYDATLADDLKNRAIKAWSWLEKNEGMHGYHHYGISNRDEGDEGHEHLRAWAAIELYALTGEDKYHDAFLKYHRPLLRNGGVELLNMGYGYASRTLALWSHDKIPYDVNKTVKKISVDRFKQACDGYVRDANRTPYGLVLNDVVKRWNMLGWFFPISDFSWDLLLAHELYGNEEYLETAEDQIHFTLGANPSNMTYVTGMGFKRLKSLVDQKSLYDSISNLVVGLPVSPVVTGYSWLENYGRDINNYTFPFDNPKENEATYGILESAYDGWNVNAEFSIEKMAGMLATLAILTPKSEEKYKYPKFKLSIESKSKGIYQPHLTFEKYKPKSYTLYWYENDELVSVDSNYQLNQNASNSIWKLSVELVTMEGRRWYDELTINTRDYEDTSIPLYEYDSKSSSSLFHLNNSLVDSENITSLSVENSATFDSENLNWMKYPKGTAVHLNGFGDQILGQFHFADYFNKSTNYTDIEEVTIEALFYINDFGESSENRLNIFKFEQSWGNSFQLLRDGWMNDLSVVLGKNKFDNNSTIQEALSLHKWHHLRFKRTRVDDTFSVDGKELLSVAHDSSEKLFDHREVTFNIGNFFGWVDEIRFVVKTK